MARMHSRKHGKSRSHKPVRDQAPVWVNYKGDEVEKLVVKLAKQNMTQALIGLTLRDQYGIPSVREITGKTVGQILIENQISSKIPEDLLNMMKRAVELNEHLQRNKKDYHSNRGFQLLESKIRRLAKYYIRMGKLPEEWKYNINAARLMVQQ